MRSSGTSIGASELLAERERMFVRRMHVHDIGGVDPDQRCAWLDVPAVLPRRVEAVLEDVLGAREDRVEIGALRLRTKAPWTFDAAAAGRAAFPRRRETDSASQSGWSVGASGRRARRRVEHGGERLVGDAHGAGRDLGRFACFRRDRDDAFADKAHGLDCENGPVAELTPEPLAPNLLRREDGANSGHGACLGGVDRDDACVSVRATRKCSPERCPAG